MPLVAPVMTAILPSSRPMTFSFFESLVPYHPGLQRAKQACPPLSAICLCHRDFSSMVGLIFDVPVG
jgi:hypothetical protein